MAKKYTIPFTEIRFYEIEVEAYSKEHAIERFDAMCEEDKSETTSAAFFLNSDIEFDEDMIEEHDECADCARSYGPNSPCKCE